MKKHLFRGSNDSIYREADRGPQTSQLMQSNKHSEHSVLHIGSVWFSRVGCPGKPNDYINPVILHLDIDILFINGHVVCTCWVRSATCHHHYGLQTILGCGGFCFGEEETTSYQSASSSQVSCGSKGEFGALKLRALGFDRLEILFRINWLQNVKHHETSSQTTYTYTQRDEHCQTLTMAQRMPMHALGCAL